jgi:hypothetical protein
MTAIVRRPALVWPLIVVASLLYGAMLAKSPQMAIGLVGGALVVFAAFAMPVAHLMLLIVFTLIVPRELQNRFGIGGGGAGLVASDVLLFTGMARGAIVLAQRRLHAPAILGGLFALAWAALLAVQFYRGAFVEGNDLSAAGDEMRRLLGFGAVLAALPIVLDPEMRPRLMRGLLVVGFLLGLWGLAQWTLNLGFGQESDFGIREGVAGTSGGRGQLQGGLYGYPVAVIIAFAVLLSGELRTPAARTAVTAVLALNGICALLTFERSFIVISVVGCAYVAFRAGGRQLVRAVALAPVALALVLVPLAMFSPDLLTTTRERLLSIGQYGTDQSVRYRVEETNQVLDEIDYHPVAGNGLGASMWWGRPERGVPPEVDYFVHNGYLWLWWKVGLIGAVLLCATLFAAALRPGRAEGSELWQAVVRGAQASLLMLLVIAVIFPSFQAKLITATMGVLLALALVPMARGRAADAGAEPA